MTDAYDVGGVVAVGVAIVASILSNAAAGRGIGDTSCRYELNYSPSNGAFGIWSVIYTFAFATVVFQAVSVSEGDRVVPLESNVLYAVAWLGATAWVPAFTSGNLTGIIFAAIFLVITAITATASSVLAALWRPGVSLSSQWVCGAAMSLLAGWTTVAAALNVGIAVKAANSTDDACVTRADNNYGIFSQPDPSKVTIVPFLLAVGASVFASVVPDPLFALPVIWAIAFMHGSLWNYFAVVLLVFACVVGFVRAYVSF